MEGHRADGGITGATKTKDLLDESDLRRADFGMSHSVFFANSAFKSGFEGRKKSPDFSPLRHKDTESKNLIR